MVSYMPGKQYGNFADQRDIFENGKARDQVVELNTKPKDLRLIWREGPIARIRWGNGRGNRKPNSRRLWIASGVSGSAEAPLLPHEKPHFIAHFVAASRALMM